MKAYVYHAKNPEFRCPPGWVRCTLKDLNDKFDCVATIDLLPEESRDPMDALECAYVRTQNGFGSWAMRKDVQARVDSARSTSVGDVVVLEEGEKEEIWAVAPVAFMKLRF